MPSVHPSAHPPARPAPLRLIQPNSLDVSYPKYNKFVAMNIFNNGSEQFIQSKQGHLNVSGNHNRIYIRNSSLTVSVNGNHNTFQLQHCNINLQVNGNANRFVNAYNNINYGFNGNNNEIVFDPNSTFTCQYSNGMNNRGHNEVRERQRPQQNNYQQGRPRNRSSERQNRPRASRPQNQAQFQSNRPQYQNSHQRRDQRQQMRSEQPFMHPMQQQGFMNGMPFQGMGFLNHIQNSLNAMFQGQRGRQTMQYQFRPNRNVFVFADDSEEEQNRGLNKQLYDLLPRNKHTGKTSNCSICLDDIVQGNEETFLICFHAFHSNCIKDWLVRNAKCPVCQFDIKEYFSK